MRKLSESAQAAKAIRKELKAAFPGVKFSVRSDNYAGGSSVHVTWDDPAADQKTVDEIIGKYQYGHFNGMDDIYEYSNTSDELPQAKFVFSHAPRA